MVKKIFANNKKAYHDYEILEKLEVGLVLSGHEVKAIKCSNVSLLDSLVKFSSQEAFVENMFIAPYEQISTHILDYNAKKKRKLLMHKQEIKRMYSKVKEKGLTVIPLEVYVGSKGKIKLLIGLAKGKKSYDKKELLKQKDIARQMAREY
ncbi:MAG: SsrA-binding protein SmpB [Endomicrobium sp.]|jgi:SsrA-binding protein|uniref:SsrA-binding protein SmpB n=1 Tax=Candidatus Endomicrobiellum cubanum TaxID=3242325 RepID=UPI0028286F1A|nr:SsrA-binding protein SmpB [Endomicrobium sp.]MDR2395448.1 SsrA-binding protein SmpB [Endomicrobium sp.]